MSKIMVVEDDASLREIYSIRITAEGYEVVSAGDGEEALAVAVREKPDLILSDVMMPKISGFDMLDILRSTPETADIKVIMMTALSADDQRKRGEQLGADRYLVKSQVGIEDVVNVIHEVLGDKQTASPAPTAQPLTAPTAPSSPAPSSVATPIAEPAPAPAPATPAPQPAGPVPASPTPIASPSPATPPSSATPATPVSSVSSDPQSQVNYASPVNPAQ